MEAVELLMSGFEYAWRVRPMSGEQFAGDACWIVEHGSRLQATLVDVLGHGPQAAELAEKVHGWLKRRPLVEPGALLRDMHRQFKGSRGMVAASALLDEDGLICSAVGNIVVRIAGQHARQHVNQDGVIGYIMAEPKDARYPFAARDVLIMHSDGLSSRFEPELFPGMDERSCGDIAEALMQRYARSTDDASCVVVKRQACS